MRYLKIFCLLAVVALLTQAVFAQKNPDVTRQELANFDHFLDSHPAIEKDLQRNPSLVKDSTYVNAHPELRDFLASHPGVREEIRENPKNFMNRERAFEKSGKDITRPEVKTFDEFLDKHPALDRELSKNPSLVNNADFVASHPELRDFLNNHPEIRQDLREHPRAFMHAEKKFDKHERKEGRVERREERREDRREERREEHHGRKH